MTAYTAKVEQTEDESGQPRFPIFLLSQGVLLLLTS